MALAALKDETGDDQIIVDRRAFSVAVLDAGGDVGYADHLFASLDPGAALSTAP